MVRQILDAFGEHWSDWELANWFASVKGYLDGEAPMDCLDVPSEMLIEAAEAAAGDYLLGQAGKDFALNVGLDPLLAGRGKNLIPYLQSPQAGYLG